LHRAALAALADRFAMWPGSTRLRRSETKRASREVRAGGCGQP
jgi:hypothetical protein